MVEEREEVAEVMCFLSFFLFCAGRGGGGGGRVCSVAGGKMKVEWEEGSNRVGLIASLEEELEEEEQEEEEEEAMEQGLSLDGLLLFLPDCPGEVVIGDGDFELRYLSSCCSERER